MIDPILAQNAGRAVHPNNHDEILSWRIFWMTMLNRSAPTAEPTLALDETEIGVLDHLVKDKIRPRRKTLGDI